MEIIHTKMGLGGLKAFTPGIYDCYSNELYHAYAAISKSDLDLLHKSAAHYRANKTAPREETADMRLGTALHCSVLEPERFTSTYIVVEGDRRTKAVKEIVRREMTTAYDFGVPLEVGMGVGENWLDAH